MIISTNYSFDSCPAELHFLGKYLLKEYQILKGQLSGDSSYRNTQLFCLNSVALRMNTITSANQFKPIRITENSGELWWPIEEEVYNICKSFRKSQCQNMMKMMIWTYEHMMKSNMFVFHFAITGNNYFILYKFKIHSKENWLLTSP